MNKIEQIEKAIKAEIDKMFYSATAPKSSLEMHILINRVAVLHNLKYELICDMETKSRISSVPNLDIPNNKTLFQAIWEVLGKLAGVRYE